MIKLIGSTLVILAATGFGLWRAGFYHERAKELQQLITALQMLETEIFYGATPLPEAFCRIGERIAGKIGLLLTESGQGLIHGDGRSAGRIFQENLLSFASKLHLKPQDFEILTALGHTLGNSDRTDQIKHIQLACTRLEAEASIAKDERDRFGKMWRYLGALTGLAVVIIMY
ncbi:stage III sporulation protein SpoIIIAB [Effusibacillus dendaii]|uniref:Stage III sporulation protein AB n=1 Tax=Effusibacillus dendaii TaxID=2743772 RepID=A0A7I8DAE4_9BACL|nr:stage III sporulation protein SpoIIIAB [Effusibacillus dendaii]BCJ85929.1 stage III sporulation protein AB [Effusibacillus dendaii]